MAAVSKGTIELLTGSEGARKMRARAMENLVMGDPVVVSPTASTDTRFDFQVVKATAGYVDGIVLDRRADANDAVDFCVSGEIEGFVGLTPGSFLSVAAGALDNTAPVAPAPSQIRVLTPTRIVKLY
jgi:hypothetical protein